MKIEDVVVVGTSLLVVGCSVPLCVTPRTEQSEFEWCVNRGRLMREALVCATRGKDEEGVDTNKVDRERVILVRVRVFRAEVGIADRTGVQFSTVDRGRFVHRDLAGAVLLGITVPGETQKVYRVIEVDGEQAGRTLRVMRAVVGPERNIEWVDATGCQLDKDYLDLMCHY